MKNADSRLDDAALDLIVTDKTITEMYKEYGFSNPTVFSTLFKEKFKCGPMEYRKQRVLKPSDEPNTAIVKGPAPTIGTKIKVYRINDADEKTLDKYIERVMEGEVIS